MLEIGEGKFGIHVQPVGDTDYKQWFKTEEERNKVYRRMQRNRTFVLRKVEK